MKFVFALVLTLFAATNAGLLGVPVTTQAIGSDDANGRYVGNALTEEGPSTPPAFSTNPTPLTPFSLNSPVSPTNFAPVPPQPLFYPNNAITSAPPMFMESQPYYYVSPPPPYAFYNPPNF
jgi:hypothetical protein